MTDTYPRLRYPERMPSSIPNLWDGGWNDEAAARVYLEGHAHAYDITLVANLDVEFEATVSRADYRVRYGRQKRPHVLEVKTDLRYFLNAIGPPGSEPFEGLRQDDESYEPHNVAWPSIVFAGYDSHGDRAELESKYPGHVIVADEDAPTGCPTFSDFQEALERAFIDEEERRAANEQATD
jgi:hypothetical protein